MQCILASLIAIPALPTFRAMLGAALEVGVTPIEVKEIVHHAAPYCGIGKAHQALLVVNEELTARGVRLPLDDQSTTDPDTRHEAGLEAQYAMFGRENVERRIAAAPPELAHIQTFLVDNCFGDNYSRTGLSLQTRELLTFVMLISLGGADPQATAHASGNANVGTDREQLIAVVTELLPYIGYPRTLNALACIDRALTPQG